MNAISKPDPRLLNVREAALELHVSIKTVRRLIERGDLPPYRIGRSIRLSEESLRIFLNRSRI